MGYESLAALRGILEENAGDWMSLRSVFSDHVRSNFLDEFLLDELSATAADTEHIVRAGVGQGSFTFVNTPDLEYSVRFVAPFNASRQLVKWSGMPQALAVRGSGALTVRTLAAPDNCDIEQFRPGVRLHECSVKELREGDEFSTENSQEIVQICAAAGPTVVQILSYRRGASNIVWTFSPALVSLYREQSSLEASRFRNVLRIAQAQGVGLSDDIYELALASSSAPVSLLAIQSMIETGHDKAFAALHRASESDQAAVRHGARAILDALFQNGDDDIATQR
ncbi:MAG: hypothetical protein ABI568_04190 [Pseudarthrobacter sp.]